MRAVLVLATLAVAAAPVHADEVEGGSVLGLGFGPAPTVSGPLSDHVSGAGTAGRIRMGIRGGRLGVEIAIVFSGLTSEGAADEQGAVMWTPTLAYYLVSTPWVQLGARAGLGFGEIGGLEHDAPGFALDTGLTAQVHLGRRRGGRAILWVDGGAQFARFDLDDTLVHGRIVQLTLGIAHGMAF